MMDFPHSPTGTTGLQKGFALAIRKVFRDKLRSIYKHIEDHHEPIKESLVMTSAITPNSFKFIEGMLEGIKFDLSPIVTTYLTTTWRKANEGVAKTLGLGDWIPYDKRIIKATQDSTYNYLIKFVEEKNKELKEILQDGISQGDSIKTITKTIRDNFKVTSWKSELIARAETIRAHGRSTRIAIENGGVTEEYKWLTSKKENVCKICRPLHGRIFKVKDKDSPMPVTNTHPQCNCGIVPHVRV